MASLIIKSDNITTDMSVIQIQNNDTENLFHSMYRH